MGKTMAVRVDGIQSVSFAVNATILQYTAVTLDATAEDTVKQAVADTRIIGITQRDTEEAGDLVAVKSEGYTLATMDAAVAIDVELVVGTNGRLKAAVATDIVVAISTQAVAAQNEVGEVKLVTPYIKA